MLERVLRRFAPIAGLGALMAASAVPPAVARTRAGGPVASAAAPNSSVKLWIVSEPIRAILKHGHVQVKVSSKQRRRVTLSLSATDAFEQVLGPSVSVHVFGPKSVVIGHTKTVMIALNGDFRDELNIAPESVLLTASLTQGRRLLVRRRQAIDRLPVPETFVPPPGTHYAGLTSEGLPISFNVAPQSRRLVDLSVTFKDLGFPCARSFDAAPRLYPDGTFSDVFGVVSGFSSISGSFSADGTARGGIGHSDRIDCAGFGISFTARPMS